MDSFYELTPDLVMTSLESQGFEPTGSIIQLNSYENRVFDIELEGGKRVVAKFYRPGRWSLKALESEHEFLAELQRAGIHVAPPLTLKNDSTIALTHDIYWSIFDKVQGRMPQEFLEGDLQRVGRVLAHIHNVGSQKSAPARLHLDVNSFGVTSLDLLSQWVLPELWNRYEEVATTLFDVLEERLEGVNYLRIHGDCHRGNLLDTDSKLGGSEFFFVDFDDFCNGPAAQDFWMLIAGDDDEREKNLENILKGYEELRHFEDIEFDLFEPLRGLRLIHYSAWIARRWEDPSFPKLFPDFNSYNYWSEEVEALEKLVWKL